MASDDYSAIKHVQETWDTAVEEFLSDGTTTNETLRRWQSAYVGRGEGMVDSLAIPEPYIGRIDQAPSMVFLGLNPGQSDSRFQHRDGVFADEIRQSGSYSAWAATWPYFGSAWVDANGENEHNNYRLRFMQDWLEDPTLTQDAMLHFELYPWHSKTIDAAMRPDPEIVREFVLDPARETGATVFAFGAKWFDILTDLLGEPALVLSEGPEYPTTTPTREAIAFLLDNGQRVVASKYQGGAHPPRTSEVAILRDSIDSGLGV